MGKYSIYVVLASLLILVSFFLVSEDAKKELIITEKEPIKSLKDETYIEKTSKIKIVTIDKNIVKITNLTENKIKPKQDTKKRFIISNTSSRNGLFKILLFSYEELNPKNENFAIGGTIEFEEFKDFYSLRFNEELLNYADKLFIEATYKTKVFKNNAFRLDEISEDYLYGVDMHLEDDFINIHPYELSKKIKFSIDDIIPKDINITTNINKVKILNENIKELIYTIQR